MASFVSSATSTHITPFCACGFGPCVVKISIFSRNPSRAYYQCPHAMSANVHKVVWDSDAVRLFLNLVVKELESSYKGSIDKNALKFKTKLLEHVELMRRVYKGNMANEASPSNIYGNARRQGSEFHFCFAGNFLEKLQERFKHSKETFSRHFHEVLQAMIPFTSIHSRSLAPEQVQQGGHPHLWLKRQYRPFKDYIGALDITHVMACVSQYATLYYGRKACQHKILLSFVTLICASRKYYLVDSGNSKQTGYLAPYKGYRYHQNANRNRIAQNEYKRFNKAHSWEALRSMPKLKFSDQVPFVCALMALHNFIRRNSETNRVTLNISDDDEYVAPQMPDHPEYTQVAISWSQGTQILKWPL
ncbi:hypothetical protein CsSME_00020004 [Camellia sinensis var. sinensis]